MGGRETGRSRGPGITPRNSTRRRGGPVLSFDDVFRSVRRRWRLVAGIFLLACIGVGVFLLSRERNKPAPRYRANVTIQIEPGSGKQQKQSNSNRKTTTTGAPLIATNGASKLAVSPAVRTAALKGAHLATNIRSIGMSASLLSDDHFLGLTVTAPTRPLASAVARSWSAAYTKARLQAAKAQNEATKRSLLKQSRLLHTELLSVDAKLAKLLPGTYGGVLHFDSDTPGGGSGGGSASTSTGPGSFSTPRPHIPDNARPYLVKLAQERPLLLDEIAGLGEKTAQIDRTKVLPDAFAQVITQTAPQKVNKTRATTVPAAGGLLGGLALAIGTAVLVDRRDRRIRDPRAAAAAFAAPVLTLVPSTTYGDYVMLSDPFSNAAEAYRGLAATSIATDRLPKAIMVSTPHGDAHEEVAANYAAALARFGLKVALIATTPDQAWYADRFTSYNPAELHGERDDEGDDESDEGDESDESAAGEVRAEAHAAPRGTTFTELLVAAHAGTLNGQLRDQLTSDDRVPNLLVIPPSEETPVQLPVDGLPPLLHALAEAGVDVTVVAGPALLEDADATIVAWATRCVLWAIVEGEVTSAEARAAAARLELAGVVPFGVVMVGHRLNAI